MSQSAVSERLAVGDLAHQQSVSIWLGLGSNVPGRREFFLQCAVDSLRMLYGQVRVSPVVESKAVGGLNEPFLNLVVNCVVECSIADVKAQLQGIEQRLHRKKGRKLITLDVDLLLYGEFIGVEDGRQIPHPDVKQHLHVLAPLLALEPDLQLPGSGLLLSSICPFDGMKSSGVHFVSWVPR